MSTSILFFGAIVLVTLGITAWAGGRTSSKADYYTAGGRISAAQNGLAISGDLLSASTFLGVIALFFASGMDAATYFVASLAGLCVMRLVIAGPLRTLGRFTLGDVIASRFPGRTLRIFSGFSTLVISLIYLVAQLLGAGSLIVVLFGLSFEWAAVLIGVLMSLYVAVGGMLAATWVQIVKAALLIGGVIFLSLLTVAHAGGITPLYEAAARVHQAGDGLFGYGGFGLDLYSSLSLATALFLGIMGLPHLLIRLFTVPGAREARQSVRIAMLIVGGVFALQIAVIAPAAVAFVQGVPDFQTAAGAVRGGTNMVAVHLAQVVGGEIMLGVIAAVAFSTILAVVAGLTMAIASAASHDIYAVLRQRRLEHEAGELWVFRFAAVGASAIAVGLAILFQHENIAFLVALALSVAAGANFPVLVLTLYWRRLTAAGALAGGLTGLLVSVTLIVLGPSVWVKLLGFEAPIFPSEHPTLATTPLAFLAAVAVSLMTEKKPAAVPGVA